MSKYETIVVFDGSLPQDAIERESKKIEELLSANGSIVKIDEWGKKYLAYTINKKSSGYYVLFVYEYNGNAGKFIDGNFKFNENIIRHLTVIHEDVSIFAPQKAESERPSDDSDEEEEE
jgi:small subunit ribosomal protein S6